jgi:competence protein ComEC
MLLVNPFYFLYDVSFQLSVAATYGLVYIAPILQKYLTHFPRIVGDVVRDTSSAQVAVLPLQLFYFGTFSWVAIFVNVIVLPIIPILMILGVLILVLLFYLQLRIL